MTYARIPDFSQPLTPRAAERTPFHADPIVAAIEAYDAAWTAWQVSSPPRRAAAFSEMGAALGRLLATPCATEFGSIALLRHLRWHIEQHGITDAPVLAYAAGLAGSLQLDFPPNDMPRSQVAPVLRSLAAASRPASRYDGPAFAEFFVEMTPGSIVPWEAVAPSGRTLHTSALRAYSTTSVRPWLPSPSSLAGRSSSDLPPSPDLLRRSCGPEGSRTSSHRSSRHAQSPCPARLPRRLAEALALCRCTTRRWSSRSWIGSPAMPPSSSTFRKLACGSWRPTCRRRTSLSSASWR